MKILTILGTRPEIIRLSGVIRLLDERSQHVLIHTGQNHDDRLSGVFFRELGVREPDISLGIRANGFSEQVGQLIARIGPVLEEVGPDRLLILGDTNSGLSAIVARRMGIPVYHMEAGNRCYDDRVPEEVNRRIIDHSSSVVMPYTERSRENLLAEGIPGNRIFVTGNPIKQVLDRFAPCIAESRVLTDLSVDAGKFFLVTMHRAENVDEPVRLRSVYEALARLRRDYGYPVVMTVHPRTASKAQEYGIDLAAAGLRLMPPLGLFDFVRLEQSAFCLLSDSGTVQEEACIFGVPNVTIRDVTERPETVECGSNILAGADPDTIVKAVRTVTEEQPGWVAPPEYLRTNVAETVCRILLSYRLPDTAEEAWRHRRSSIGGV